MHGSHQNEEQTDCSARGVKMRSTNHTAVVEVSTIGVRVLRDCDSDPVGPIMNLSIDYALLCFHLPILIRALPRIS